MSSAGPSESRFDLGRERECLSRSRDRKAPSGDSTYGVLPGRLSTFVDDSPYSVDNLVDAVGADA